MSHRQCHTGLDYAQRLKKVRGGEVAQVSIHARWFSSLSLCVPVSLLLVQRFMWMAWIW